LSAIIKQWLKKPNFYSWAKFVFEVMKGMSITRKDVEHVAKLARLAMTPDEMDKVTEQLSDIVRYVEKLNELDTEGIEPLAHVLPVYNVFREDKVWESLEIEKVLHNAPDKEGRFFKVPAVIES
jgi:aspartyl-tRNA(Asn)/glutamyl-tRNA(Gln) amidotransferase subunit C